MKELEIQSVAVIPAFNESATVGNVVRSALRAETIDAVIVVDDGSLDNTGQNATDSAATEAGNDTPFFLVNHEVNQGKTEALVSGVDCARELGSAALSTIVFLDADSSPIWSRDTEDNMKLWQSFVNRLAHVPPDSLSEETVIGREDAFITLLSRYIDEITEPVLNEENSMRIGMYQRNVITDTVLRLMNFGGHAGNRALTLKLWDELFANLSKKGISVSDWEIEAALNSSVSSDEVSSFLMHGVVNVGSRKKAGSFTGGLKRMGEIHSQAIRGMKKFR